MRLILCCPCRFPISRPVTAGTGVTVDQRYLSPTSAFFWVFRVMADSVTGHGVPMGLFCCGSLCARVCVHAYVCCITLSLRACVSVGPCARSLCLGPKELYVSVNMCERVWAPWCACQHNSASVFVRYLCVTLQYVCVHVYCTQETLCETVCVCVTVFVCLLPSSLPISCACLLSLSLSL